MDQNTEQNDTAKNGAPNTTANEEKRVLDSVTNWAIDFGLHIAGKCCGKKVGEMVSENAKPLAEAATEKLIKDHGRQAVKATCDAATSAGTATISGLSTASDGAVKWLSDAYASTVKLFSRTVAKAEEPSVSPAAIDKKPDQCASEVRYDVLCDREADRIKS